MTDAMIVCLTITYMKLSFLIPPLAAMIHYFILIAFYSVVFTSKLIGLLEEDAEADIWKAYGSYINILREFKPIEEEDIKNVRALNHFFRIINQVLSVVLLSAVMNIRETTIMYDVKSCTSYNGCDRNSESSDSPRFKWDLLMILSVSTYVMNMCDLTIVMLNKIRKVALKFL